MKTRLIFGVVLCVVLFSVIVWLSSCTTVQDTETAGEVMTFENGRFVLNSFTAVHRLYDYENGIVCYAWEGYNAGGIDCFLISELSGGLDD